MAVVYPEVNEASNPPTTVTVPEPVTGGLGGFARLFNQPNSGVMRLLGPSFEQDLRDRGFFEPNAELTEREPSRRVPLTPPPAYEPGMDPMFNYFEGQPPPDAGVIGGNERYRTDSTVSMKEGSKGLVAEARRVQQQGRNGDTMLVHVAPEELAAIDSLKSTGLGGLVQNGVTINPETGLPEMFNFKSILPMIAGIAASAFGLGPVGVALATGATTTITTGDVGKGLLAGLGSFALGSLFSGIGASGVSDVAATQAAQTAGAASGGAAGAGQVAANVGSAVPAAYVPDATTLANAPSNIIGGGVGEAVYGAAGGAPSGVTAPVFSPASFSPASITPVGPGPFTGLGATTPPVAAPTPTVELTPEALTAARTSVFENAPLSTAFDSTATGPSKFDLFGEGLSKIGEPGGVSYLDVAQKGLFGGLTTASGMGAFDPEPYEYAEPTGKRTYSSDPTPPLNRTALSPPEDYRPGFDSGFSYFGDETNGVVGLQGGKRGELDQSSNMMEFGRNPTPQSAQQITSNAGSAPAKLNPARYSANAATRLTAGIPVRRMANGGVPEEQAMAGLMDVASNQVRNNLEERMSVPAQDSEPQNVEERIVYDNAMLAVQGVLEAEAAQEAISDFIETFGMAAYEALVASVNEPRDEGGVIKPANGETTVQEGAIQGEDVIAGMIVDPETGEESANLRIGENEYVEPAESLARRAMAAGLPPTPKNGAMVRSAEEDQLRMAYG